MTVETYQGLLIASGLVWRFIATIRTPILHPLRDRLKGLVNGAYIYSVIVWVIAFLAGYALAATAPGESGSILHAVGWLEDYIQIGWASTAVIIASGSAGLRVAEKLFDAKVNPDA